jgi:hypothetical protein
VMPRDVSALTALGMAGGPSYIRLAAM